MPSTLPFMPADSERIEISALETWLWDAACVIRGATDAPKFKDFILPLVFYKRLSDVFDDECAGYIEQYGDEDTARAIIAADHEDALRAGRQPIVRFYVPGAFAWRELRTHPADGGLGEFVIVHELVHPLAPNHGRVFKSFVHAYLPDWRERERRLWQIARDHIGGAEA